MQFQFFRNRTRQFIGDALLEVGGRQVSLVLVCNPRARRYVMRLRSDGSASVTIPRGGSATEARKFADRCKGWLEQAIQRHAARPVGLREWKVGTPILFRGENLMIENADEVEENAVQFGGQVVKVTDLGADLRPAIEKHLRQLAAMELPPRVQDYATKHQIAVNRIPIRGQRSRWGSCSRRGTISLNWRLIQSPLMVRDYIILHELMHLRQMNHSARFWQEVKEVCPDYESAECWLKQHSSLLR